MSKAPLEPPQYVNKSQFACLSLNETDKIRLIRFPQNAQDAVEQAIHQGWHKGIQRKQMFGEAMEFKLRGRFLCGQMDEAVPARRLMLCILRNLKMIGWKLLASTDISSGRFDKDVMIFRLENPDAETSLFCISLNQSDKLRLIDYPPGLEVFMQDLLPRIWKKGIQEFKFKEHGCAQFKLYGNPWFGFGTEPVSSSFMVMELLCELESKGWYLYGTVDMSVGNGEHGGGEKDTWFFEFDSRLIRQ